MTPQQIMDRFFYRKNPFAVQTSKGFYIPVHRDVTLLDIENHLTNGHTIGAYCAREDETCMWGCIDFDDVSYEQIAKDMVLKHTNHISGIPYSFNLPLKKIMFEKSESKGYHVWFFFQKPETTEKAYNFVSDVLHDFYLRSGRDTKIDIFPRSPHLSGKKVGWLVRLPRKFEEL